MGLFCGGVGIARQKANNIFDWRILALIIILLSILIFNKSASGQSPTSKNEMPKVDTLRQIDQKSHAQEEFNVAFYRTQPFLLSMPFLHGSTKSFFDKRGKSKRFEDEDNLFWTKMNLKIDSAWREFDHRCRGRGKL